ncbi:hypothetical protein [Clavibacter capsici]|uniref:hypothetical protein n=1 Tax=Clavibacter capsici TaxID=1874630 RepID=UPI0014287373|nr:hypothetical protein [Clavibacter capsici]QIS38596.1 hypothetical protein GW572_04275 [Clavibacter capsici]
MVRKIPSVDDAAGYKFPDPVKKALLDEAAAKAAQLIAADNAAGSTFRLTQVPGKPGLYTIGTE